jgi:Zn-finger nucleic acid-binding protein
MLTCPFCGGPCSWETRVCPHCDVDLATARCPQCYALAFTGARFCGRCGAELRLEPLLDASDAPCPRCAKPLRTTADGVAYECLDCRGLFIEPTIFARMAADREAASLPFAPPPPPSARLSGPDAEVRYLKCPVCRAVMNRTNFGHRSGVIVDVCKFHGTWFDDGELTRVLEWIAAGGAREQRRRFYEQQEESPGLRERKQAEARILIERHKARAAGEPIPSADTFLEILTSLFSRDDD